MFAFVMQATGAMSPEQIQELQAQATAAVAAASQGAQQSLPQATAVGAGATGAGLGALAGAMMLVTAFFAIIGIVLVVLTLLNIYHWGMTDKAVFQSANEDKKKWFYILILVPAISGASMVIPFLGWLVAGVGYIYWLVMTVVYFFGLRVKLK
jgi:hypothetical protein